MGGLATAALFAEPGLAPSEISSKQSATSREFPESLPTFGEPDLPGWTRVNEKTRHRMPAKAATQCLVLPNHITRGAHADAYTETFVNDIGKSAMMSPPVAYTRTSNPETAIRFPEGSVIIKVKYANSSGGIPLLRTVMIKRKTGYNPDCGDWEFVTTDAIGIASGDRGKISHCMNCHQHDSRKVDDHTFRRDYLPPYLLQHLRFNPEGSPRRTAPERSPLKPASVKP